MLTYYILHAVRSLMCVYIYSLGVYAALKCVCQVLLKWRATWSPPTDLLLQHLTLLLRQKSSVIQTLLSEQSCSVESFRWRAQLLYSMDDTESFYTLKKDIVASPDGRGSSTSISSDSSSVSRQHLIHSSLDFTKSSLNNKNKLKVSPIIGRKETSYPPLRIFVHCYESTLSYGFEFLGASAHLCLTSQTEASLLSLVQAVGSRVCPLINTTCSPSNKSVSGKDLSIVSH